MERSDSGDPKQSTADMSSFVQNLLQQMQTRFQSMSDNIVSKNILDLVNFDLCIYSFFLDVLSDLFLCDHIGNLHRNQDIAFEDDNILFWYCYENLIEFSFSRKISFQSSYYVDMNILLNYNILDEMGSRINELEQSINDLRAEMGVEGGTPPPLKSSPEEVKPKENTPA